MKKYERFGALVRIGCCVCRRETGQYATPVIHHLRGHPWSGMGRRAKDEYTIPLCPAHHQYGGHGTAYHAGAREFEARHGTQAELLEWTNGAIERLNGSAGDET